MRKQPQNCYIITREKLIGLQNFSKNINSDLKLSFVSIFNVHKKAYNKGILSSLRSQ